MTSDNCVTSLCITELHSTQFLSCVPTSAFASAFLLPRVGVLIPAWLTGAVPGTRGPTRTYGILHHVPASPASSACPPARTCRCQTMSGHHGAIVRKNPPASPYWKRMRLHICDVDLWRQILFVLQEGNSRESAASRKRLEVDVCHARHLRQNLSPQARHMPAVLCCKTNAICASKSSIRNFVLIWGGGIFPFDRRFLRSSFFFLVISLSSL